MTLNLLQRAKKGETTKGGNSLFLAVEATRAGFKDFSAFFVIPESLLVELSVTLSACLTQFGKSDHVRSPF